MKFVMECWLEEIENCAERMLHIEGDIYVPYSIGYIARDILM